jgi:hypothetical protein
LTQPVASRLATLKPDAPTIISVHKAKDEIAVTVDALQGAELNEAVATSLVLIEPARILELIEEALERIEENALQFRPEGLITPGEVASHHLAYFQIREQAQRVREMWQRIEARKGYGKTPMTSRARGRSISASQFTLRQTNAGDLWHQLIKAADIHNLLKELATKAQPHGEHPEDYLAELIRETSMLETLAQGNTDEQSNRLLLLIRTLDESRRQERQGLAKAYAELFEHKFAMQVKRLSTDVELVSLHAEALVISGVNATTLAQCEAGTHLFYTRQGGLAPIQVNVLPLNEGDEMTAIGSYAGAVRWPMLQNERDNALRLLPVIRVY